MFQTTNVHKLLGCLHVYILPAQLAAEFIQKQNHIWYALFQPNVNFVYFI